MTERIVVATDGGAASHASLDWVIDRALTAPCEVELVTVEDLNWLPVAADRSEYIRQYHEVLESAAQYLSGRPGISFIATRLLAGDPAEEIADAERSPANWSSALLATAKIRAHYRERWHCASRRVPRRSSPWFPPAGNPIPDA